MYIIRDIDSCTAYNMYQHINFSICTHVLYYNYEDENSTETQTVNI